MKKVLLTICLVGLFVSVQGCILQDVPHIGGRWIRNQRIQYVNQHPELPSKIRNYILTEKICLGMTAEQVRVSWGNPYDINRTVGSWGSHEQWVYGEKYLYFDNGILTSWQD